MKSPDTWSWNFSVLRLRTSIRVAVGILLGAVVVAFPSYFSSIFGPPFISLVPLYIGMSAAIQCVVCRSSYLTQSSFDLFWKAVLLD
jgi:hypothetical protein